MIAALPPIPVAVPLLVAGLLLALGRHLPARLPDVIAIAVALASCVTCALMAVRTAEAPLVYWFGGWVPRDGLVLGIGFVVDQVGASLAAFAGLLFAAALVFAWAWFDEVHAHFHVLMLLFLAGMTGFCLTHDLFNLFVWFEVMSVAAFALTGYALRSSALEGALNFTVVNTLASYLILGGIGLLYAVAGALDFTALGQGVARAPGDPVIAASFALLAAGLLIKASQVPFHFWLSDAHAVAPSPVSVIFSGLMVALGVYGLARLVFTVFAGAPAIMEVARTLLAGMGAASAVLGGLMALGQRHIKRLLAFSTISHTGILLIGLALLSRGGLSGMFVYMAGHGLVKGALFMCAGILLALRADIDEFGLRGAGRGLWPVGAVMAVGGLLLAGLPVGWMDEGLTHIDSAARDAGRDWLTVAALLGTATTGAAVLRVTGRVFLGLGAQPGAEADAPTEKEQEKADRPLWLMLAPALTLLMLSLVGAHAAGGFAGRAVVRFMQPDFGAVFGPATPPPPAPPLPAPEAAWPAWLSVALALAIAAFELSRGRLPRRIVAVADWITVAPVNALQRLHTGRIGDYVAWVAGGLALFAIAFALA